MTYYKYIEKCKYIISMNVKNGLITIRDATINDARLLCLWWNNGKVMEHAGFPYGLETTEEKIKGQLEKKDNNFRHIIEYKNNPIGEMNYIVLDDNVCDIGIKICEFSMQNKGLGKKILSLFISTLFNELKFKKVILSTDLRNLRAQHVYERLGFKKVKIFYDSWTDQLGKSRTSVCYELVKKDFISFL